MSLVILLALAGVIFISLEIILPGMILGIIGALSSLAALYIVFTTDDLPSFFLGPGGRFLLASIILLLSVTMIGLWLKYFDRVPIGKNLILKTSSDGKIGYAEDGELLGIRGTAVTDLRPSGKVKIEGLPKTCDVIAEGGFIESGANIEIIKVDGRRVLVRQVTATI